MATKPSANRWLRVGDHCGCRGSRRAFGRRPAPAGAAGRAYKVHTWVDRGGDVHRVRWNPCQTITFAVNPRLAGKSDRATRRAIADVREAFHRAGKRTGLTFRYTGRTSEVPEQRSQTSWSTRQKAAEIVVAWVDQDRSAFRTDLLSR